MRRIICWITIFYILGIIVSNALSIEHLIPLLFILFISFIFKLIIGGSFKMYSVIFFAVSFIVGIIMFQLFDDISLRSIGRYIDKPLSFTGEIISHPEVKDNKIECILKVKEIVYQGEKRSINEKVRLVVKTGKDRSDVQFNYKDSITVRGEFKVPAREMNEGGFNYNQYLKSQGIHVMSYVLLYSVKKLESGMPSKTLADYALFIRRSMIETINKNLPFEEAALLKAMTAGDRNDFSEDMQTNFKKSGLSHIVAVSGMHVAILLGGVFILFKFLRLNKSLANIICIFLVILYVFITGASPSVVRAGIMATLFLLSYLLSREADALTSLFFAALLMLLLNPITLFNAGFQLSFCATLALLIFCKPIYNKLLFLETYRAPKSILALLSATITAQIGTLPLVAYHFNGVSLISILSNLVVVPMTSAVLIGGIILTIVGNVSSFLSAPVSGFVYVILKIILISSKFFANMPFAYVVTKSPSILFIIIYLLMLYMLYNLIREKRDYIKIKITLCVLILSVVIAGTINVIDAGYLKVTFINVGQGDSILVQAPGGKNVLIDGGGTEGEAAYDIGNNVLVPFLIKRGVRHVDIVAVTHYHVDHAKGIIAVLENIKSHALVLPYKDDENYLYKNLLDTAAKRNVNVYYVSRGDNIYLSNSTEINVLFPNDDILGEQEKNPNNKSLVLKLSYGLVSFIFTGDIEKKAEDYLLRYTQELDADVIKVAHHGSKTSSNEDFIKAVSPYYAAISVGTNNFGHPSNEVLNLLNKQCYSVFRTDINGTINFYSNKKKIKKISVLREGD